MLSSLKSLAATSCKQKHIGGRGTSAQKRVQRRSSELRAVVPDQPDERQGRPSVPGLSEQDQLEVIAIFGHEEVMFVPRLTARASARSSVCQRCHPHRCEHCGSRQPYQMSNAAVEVAAKIT
jgi:hypothetical protein